MGEVSFMKRFIINTSILTIIFSSMFFIGFLLLLNKNTTSKIFLNPETEQEQVAFSDLYHQFRKAKTSVRLNVPTIKQYPELPRGCEVTALAMLLENQNYNTTKMQLAKEIKKNPARYKIQNGEIHFGNPHYGFVGDIYTRKNPGLGVYVEPIIDLAYKYAGTNVINLTNQKELEIMFALSDGLPVWIITNTTYEKLPKSAFETWHTPQGKIKITYKEHSVVITGYDNQYYYFNDPLDGKKKKAPKASFIEAWKQMGSQAITIQSSGS